MVDEAALPHPLRAVAYLTNGKRFLTETIMKMLDGQNHGLNFSTWRLLKRVNRNTNAMLVWAIDVESAERLKSKGNKLSFGFRQISVRLKTEIQTEDDQLIEEMNSLEMTTDQE